MNKKYLCCFCKKKGNDFGNNPHPLKEDPNRCCNDCNWSKVIPARLKKNKKTI